MLPEVIEAGRFRLRPFELADADAVFEYASDEAWLQYLRIPTPYRRLDAENFLSNHIVLDRRLNPSWAIEVNGRASGGLNIRFFSEHRVSEIGYGVARKLWGQGFATEAAGLVIGK